MRNVIYKEPVKRTEDGRQFWDFEEKGKAKFHQFGVSYEEFESGPGNYSTAIIELGDGTIKNIPVEQIKFID